MRTKTILTSVCVMALATVARAETFPSDGLMQIDTTYNDAATYSNMGVYDGAVSASAEYNDCPANSYCDGTSDTPIACPSGYGNSDAGSDSASDCYRACTASDVLNATTVSGRVYSDGTNACDATGCENGYSVQPGTDLNTIIGTVAGDDHTKDSSTMTFSVDYGDLGSITGRTQCSSQSGIGVWNGASSADEVTTIATLPDSTGQYCYCTLDGYTPVGGGTQSLSGPWVFNTNYGNADRCADFCAGVCVGDLQYDGTDNLVFRAAVFGSLGAFATCAANTITIKWNGTTDAAIAATNAGQCTYNGDIRTPQSATPVAGKTFKGWKFVK